MGDASHAEALRALLAQLNQWKIDPVLQQHTACACIFGDTVALKKPDPPDTESSNQSAADTDTKSSNQIAFLVG